MNAETIKKRLVRACHRVYARGFVAGYEGNLSARISPNAVIVTPARLCKGDVTVKDLVTVDRGKPAPRDARRSHGSQRSRNSRRDHRPTAELEMHLMVYDERPDVEAVVHAHPPVATGFAVAGVTVPERALPEVIVALGSIPLVPYALPGTAELANAIRKYMKTADAFLLANHGVLTVGTTIEEAYYRMEMVEQVARSVLAARIVGAPVELSEAEIEALRRLMGE
jgi:L-fuculose-phosphate aldolase